MARRVGRVLVAITLCLTALGAGLGPASAAPTGTTAAPIPPHAWIVADAGTGEILEAHSEHTALPPASTTKIMTALTAVERVPPDAVITVSPLAASQPASRINMAAGQHWKFRDAMASLMVVSANDAAYAIAERAAGSIAGFAAAEAVTGRQLGLEDSTFSDPAGLDDGRAFRGGPLMSAYDVAITARNALRVPFLAQLAACPAFDFTGPDGFTHHLVNHNKLVSEHLYAGANGFKTGFTDKALHTLTATATRNGRTLIAVVLGTWDAYGWAERFLDAGFAIPPGHGTGASLPPVRITTYASRAAQFTAFRALAAGSAKFAAGIAAPNGSSPSPSSAPSTSARAASVTTGAVAFAGAPSSTTVKRRSGGGRSATSIAIWGFVLLLAVLYILRVRAVRRARARRLARRRATHSMMRRGGLPVVDGRYRTGTRVGNPVESHVQIRRDHGDREASGS